MVYLLPGRAGAVRACIRPAAPCRSWCSPAGPSRFLLFSTVSIRVLHTTPASPEAASGPNPVATAGAVPITGSQGGVAGLGGSGNRQAIPPGLGGSSLATGPSLAGVGPNAAAGSGGTDPAPAPAQGGAGGGTGSGTGSGGSSSTPASQAPAAPSSSAPQPAPSATQPANSGVCLKVGPLGLCLNV
jgi:hypothetical protein